MNQIIPNLWIGNWHDARDCKGGIHIVTVAVDSPFIGAVKFDLVDGPGNDLEVYRKAVKHVAGELLLGVKVLVHCVGGRSRSAAVICAALSGGHCADYNAAYAIVKKAKDDIGIHPALYDLHCHLGDWIVVERKIQISP